MLEFMGFLIIVCILGFLALMINGFIVARRKGSLPTELFNHEMFAERKPVVEELPNRAVADSHWHVKTFMRPRRKLV
ncbi:hypothetical protein ACIQGW_05255 [Lysinibacillus xylanilyticus]|uniref:hypothetical protein n=1 Tax=Lysinibacillus xylanilyticus TaxID=582475 RepID=UPI003810BD53